MLLSAQCTFGPLSPWLLHVLEVHAGTHEVLPFAFHPVALQVQLNPLPMSLQELPAEVAHAAFAASVQVVQIVSGLGLTPGAAISLYWARQLYVNVRPEGVIDDPRFDWPFAQFPTKSHPLFEPPLIQP